MSEAAITIAELFIEQQDHDSALQQLAPVISEDKTNVEAHNLMAICYIAKQQWLEALNSIINALGYGHYQDKHMVVLVQILEVCGLTSYVPQIEQALIIGLKSRWIEGYAVNLLNAQFKAKYQKELAVPEQSSKLDQILRDPSLALIIERTCVTDHHLERVLLWGREEILKCAAQHQDIKVFLPFLAALACQTLLNNGLYATSIEEQQLLDKISNQPQPALEQLVLQICYADFEQAIALFMQHKSAFGSPAVAGLSKDLLFYQQVIRKKTYGDSKLNDETSKVVQAFYGENPYPKYKSLTASAITIKQIFEQNNKQAPANPNLLIAGCGTGAQVIEIAFANPNANITAIDISPVSLAYATQMAHNYQVDNIEFKLLDILEVEQLKQSFDYIMCTGVLHHMQNPEQGLIALTRLLNPDGIMLLGLYSKAARQFLKEVKSMVLADLNLTEAQLTAPQLCQWRTQLPVQRREQIWFSDFFNLSGLMDAVFHPQQREYDLLEVEKMLTVADLNFTQMVISNQQKSLYAQQLLALFESNQSPTLANWHDFETQNPQFFAAMFNFFVSQ